MLKDIACLIIYIYLTNLIQKAEQNLLRFHSSNVWIPGKQMLSRRMQRQRAARATPRRRSARSRQCCRTNSKTSCPMLCWPVLNTTILCTTTLTSKLLHYFTETGYILEYKINFQHSLYTIPDSSIQLVHGGNRDIPPRVPIILQRCASDGVLLQSNFYKIFCRLARNKIIQIRYKATF